MRISVIIEHRFERTPDGRIWTQTQFAYPFWHRYLEIFDQVHVVARIRDVPATMPGWQYADGDGVCFAIVPHYIGPWQYIRQAHQVKRAVQEGFDRNGALIMRVGSHLATCVEPYLQRTGYPYGVEVIYDPYDMFAPGSIRHPTRPFFRWLFPYQMRRQCAAATAAAYVTEHALQRRYPSGPQAFSTYYSDVELVDGSIVDTPRQQRLSRHQSALVTVGSFDHMYKAPDVLIDAVAQCIYQGEDMTLTVIGDGKHRLDLEARVNAQGLQDRVFFRGKLTAGSAVRNELDQADLFVLPSRQEGLPRAMIEAMARALPCIGSTIGGIPELLPPEDLVPPGDARALAIKISEIVHDPQRMALMSARNLTKATSYSEAHLRGRRNAFYRYLREATQSWLVHQNRHEGTLSMVK